jgi:Cof subfamily protein (haloacid dehalogenase superfamily)
MPIRLIALDIDGTLLDSTSQVSAANKEAVAEAIRRGIEVALVTGRRYDFARPIFEQLQGPLTLIVNNGALVKTSEGDTLFRHFLPLEVARRVLASTEPFRAGAGIVFDRPRAGQVIFESIDWDHPRRRAYAERNLEFIGEVTPLESCLTEDPIQVMFTGGVEEMRELFRALTTGESARDFSVSVTEYESRDFSLVDVLAAGCSKGATLRHWALRRGLDRSEIMAVGDNLNDLEMLQFAGHPVVMGNCVPALRELGCRETLSNDEDGVALAIERVAFATGS